MAPFRKLRPGPVGIAFALFDVWRRLPPKQRRQVMNLAREQDRIVRAALSPPSS